MSLVSAPKTSLNKKLRPAWPFFVPTLIVITLFSIIGSLVSFFAVLAVSNRTNLPINYQGRLSDTNYVPVNDVSRDVKFVIYDASSGGTCVWATGSSSGVAHQAQ